MKVSKCEIVHGQIFEKGLLSKFISGPVFHDVEDGLHSVEDRHGGAGLVVSLGTIIADHTNEGLA